jgi:hypothetical protein
MLRSRQTIMTNEVPAARGLGCSGLRHQIPPYVTLHITPL